MGDSDKTSKILVVEDSKTQAYQLSCLLQNNGYTVSTVNSARDAIDAIAQDTPSLVITDIIMPGMSGYELCAAIRKNEVTRDIPVILLTSLTSPQDIISALECGADDFISKPFKNDFLIEKLRKFFSRKSGPTGNEEKGNSEDVIYSGKGYQISSNKQKMLDLMISAYEATIQKNHELLEAQEALVKASIKLEVSVSDKEKAFEIVRQKEDVLKQWNSELHIMNLLGAVINQSVTLDDFLQNVAEGVLNYGFAGAKFGIEFLLIAEDGKRVLFYKYNIKEGSINILENGERDEGFDDILNQQELVKITPGCLMPSCYWKERSGGKRHGHISILLLAKERKIGLMNFVSVEDFNPEEHVCDMLASLGKQLGMAVENHNLYTETKRLSLHDPLTGLSNRRMIDIFLDNEMARANRYESIFCLLMIDIDYFKQYNDKFGHNEGDRVLTALSSYLKENIRDTDLAARYGGEEFVVIISEKGIDEACKIAERHLKIIQEKIGITVSMGIAEYKSGQTSADLIKSADDALYLAKKNGRNRIEIAQPA